MTRNLVRKYGPTVTVGLVSAMASMASMAQAVAGGDYGSAAAISAAQVVALAITGAFITMGIAVWGATYILRRFFPKGK